MHKMQRAFLLKDRWHVVFDKSHVINAKDYEFEEVSVCIPMSLIKEMAEEIEFLELDEEEEF